MLRPNNAGEQRNNAGETVPANPLYELRRVGDLKRGLLRLS